jgi:hypothetical protein
VAGIGPPCSHARIIPVDGRNAVVDLVYRAAPIVEQLQPTCVLNLVGYGVTGKNDGRGPAPNSELVEEIGRALAGLESDAAVVGAR